MSEEQSDKLPLPEVVVVEKRDVESRRKFALSKAIAFVGLSHSGQYTLSDILSASREIEGYLKGG